LTTASLAADASLKHLLGRLHLLELRLREAARRRRAAEVEPDDRFRGLYISPAEVERLLTERRSPLTDLLDESALQAIEAEADQAQTSGADLRLRRLRRSFRLDELDVDLLLIALAPDLDARFERLYGYLQDDVSRRRASVGLGLELCGAGSASAEARRRLAAGSALIDGRLILVEEADRPFLTRSLRVPDRVTAYLLGDDGPDPVLAALIHYSDLGQELTLSDLHRWAEADPRLAYVRQPPGAETEPIAAAAFEAAGRPTLSIDLNRLRPEDDIIAIAALTAREARLLGAGVVAGPIEMLSSRGLPAVRAFSEIPVPLVLSGSVNWDPAWSKDVPLLCEAPVIAAPERARLWRSRLNGDLPAGSDPGVAMAAFRLTPEQVFRATVAARRRAAAADRPVRMEDLKAGARAQNAAGLERLARRIEPAVGFADLVLPPDTIDQLQDLMVRARRRDRVLDEWKMAGPAARRRGLSALFAGPSGTGKTMAAEVLAHELGLDLYAVDLATVVDKYVGETEKNLDRIFAEAERVNGVVLFDEADALFGKRSEVRDAHDRYANVETAYLLQRMELFDGIAILASNLRSNLDEAFTRRLDAVIDFPEPEEPYRRRLWQRCLGDRIPTDPDVDLGFLARSFKLAGGSIRNITVAAAYRAADEDRPLRMVDLIRATQREYLKMGRLCVESEFGPYYGLLATSSISG
jgi:hypothetical protein